MQPSVECYISFSKASLSIDIKVYSCTCASDLLIFFLFKKLQRERSSISRSVVLFKTNQKKKPKQKTNQKSPTKLMLPVQKLLKMTLLNIQHFIYGKNPQPCFHFPFLWVTPGLASTYFLPHLFTVQLLRQFSWSVGPMTSAGPVNSTRGSLLKGTEVLLWEAGSWREELASPW